MCTHHFLYEQIISLSERLQSSAAQAAQVAVQVSQGGRDTDSEIDNLLAVIQTVCMHPFFVVPVTLLHVHEQICD